METAPAAQKCRATGMRRIQGRTQYITEGVLLCRLQSLGAEGRAGQPVTRGLVAWRCHSIDHRGGWCRGRADTQCCPYAAPAHVPALPCASTWPNPPAPGLPPDQVVVSDHVVLRGRYTAVDVQLYGRAEHDAVTVAAAAVEAAVASGNPMDPQDESRLARYTQQQRQQQLRAGPGAKRQRVQPPMALPLAPPMPREAQGQQQDGGAGEGGEPSRAWADGTLAPAPQLMPPGGSPFAPAGSIWLCRARLIGLWPCADGVGVIRGWCRGCGPGCRRPGVRVLGW